MTRVILDAGWMTKLLNLTQPLELCDQSGIVRAQLIPVLDPAEYEPTLPPKLGAEELQRREQETEEYTTAEVLSYLETL